MLGLQRLAGKIARLEAERAAVLGQAGEAAVGDTNAWHDNFAYEEGMREQSLLARRIMDFREIQAAAVEAPAPRSDEVAQLGHVATIRFDDGEPVEYLICGDGEAAFFRQACSTASPLGSLLVGRGVGEVFYGTLGGRFRRITLVALRIPEPADPATEEDPLELA